jgi:hypothetical protein
VSDFPWFQRLFVAFGGLVFLAGAFTIAVTAVREQQLTVDRAILFTVAVTAGGLFLWLAIYIKGYTRKAMDGTPFLAPPEYAPDACVYRFRTGFRSLGGVVVDPSAQWIHFCNCHSLSVRTRQAVARSGTVAPLNRCKRLM